MLDIIDSFGLFWNLLRTICGPLEHLITGMRASADRIRHGLLSGRFTLRAPRQSVELFAMGMQIIAYGKTDEDHVVGPRAFVFVAHCICPQIAFTYPPVVQYNRRRLLAVEHLRQRCSLYVPDASVIEDRV